MSLTRWRLVQTTCCEAREHTGRSTATARRGASERARKDPGITPLSLLELLKRRGRYRPEDFTRLNLGEPFDLAYAKRTWRYTVRFDSICATPLAVGERIVLDAEGGIHALQVRR